MIRFARLADIDHLPVIARHVNSAGELVTIERLTQGPHRGEYVLILRDDGPDPYIAPLLLDYSTIRWLYLNMIALEPRTD